MWQISTKGRYGTRLMYQLAANYGQGPILLKEIAKREELSPKYLEQIVLPLRGAGLISSTRGPHGGYSLTRTPKEINLKDVLAVLEGDITPVECLMDPDSCKDNSGCRVRTVWAVLEKNINETLQGITLEDMVKMDCEDGCENCQNE